MHDTLLPYYHAVALTGDLQHDVVSFLQAQNANHTAAHSVRVAAVAAQLAAQYGLECTAARQSGLLHDISVVVPNHERIALAEQLGLPVLDAERQLPMIVHQKLSAFIAADVFGIANSEVLSAIGCHTTLRAGASLLDMVVFVGDKIAWDQPGDPPYLAEITAAMACSLRDAALVYLRYLWERRATLAVVHPWMVEAYTELAGRPGAECHCTA